MDRSTMAQLFARLPISMRSVLGVLLISAYSFDARIFKDYIDGKFASKFNYSNLFYIPKLIELYPDHIIGYSGHEEGISAILVAATLGAKVIERHVTINRAMWGTDQAASIELSGLRRLVRDLKKLPIWLGNGKKVVTKSEELMKKKLRNVETL